MKSVSSRLIRARPLLGTFVEISATGGGAREREVGVEAAFKAISRVHDRMSFHSATSDVARLNRARPGEAILVDEWTYRLLRLSLDLQQRSRGVFNIAVGPFMQRLGLLPRVAVDSSPPVFCLEYAIELLPGNRVRMQRLGIKIDVGGIAKGFAVDRAVEVLQRHGIESGVVNAGGDLAAFGRVAQRVDIRDPRDPVRLLGSAVVQRGALASSGPILDLIEGGLRPYSAVIDPTTGKPATAVCGATVKAASCWVADGLTKVAMILGRRSSELLHVYNAAALLVTARGKVEATTNWQGALSVAA